MVPLESMDLIGDDLFAGFGDSTNNDSSKNKGVSEWLNDGSKKEGTYGRFRKKPFVVLMGRT